MAKRVLDMLIWHPKRYREMPGYILHRGNREKPYIPASNIEGLKGGFMIMVDGSMVPYHRIVKIECEDKLIWAKNIKGGDFND